MDRHAVINATLPPSDDFYRDGFHKLMWIVNVQAAVIVALTLVFCFTLHGYARHDSFAAETEEGRRIPMPVIDSPNMGREALSNWIADSASQIMTFGFNDIDRRFARSRRYFTARGWDYFYQALADSKLTASVVRAQQIVTAIPAAPPVLMQEGLINGEYSWVFEMPLLMTFRSGGVKQSMTKTLHAVVRRVPPTQNPDGVGIEEWYLY